MPQEEGRQAAQELQMHKDAVLKADNQLTYLRRLMGEALGTPTTSWRREHRDYRPAEWGDYRPGRDEVISILMDRVEEALKRRLELDTQNGPDLYTAGWGKHGGEEARKSVDRLRTQVDERAGRRWVRKQRNMADKDAMAIAARRTRPLETEQERKVREACEHMRHLEAEQEWNNRGGGVVAENRSGGRWG